MSKDSRLELLLAMMRRWEAVNRCLATLSEAERHVFIARRVMNQDLPEIARSLKITKERCRILESRAAQKLMDMLMGGTPLDVLDHNQPEKGKENP